MTTDLRLYMDEHIPYAITKAPRARGFDVMRPQECSMLGALDPEHLAAAHADGRVIVTQFADFLRLDAAGIEHSGILYAQQGTGVGRIVRRVGEWAEHLKPDDWANRVAVL